MSSTPTRTRGALWADLVVTLLLASLAFVGALKLGPDNPLRAILAVPLVLLLPGYSFVAAIDPSPSMDLPRRVVLGMALSVSLAVLVGLVLNLTPWGLTSAPWTITLVAITVFCSVIALVRLVILREPRSPVRKDAKTKATPRQLALFVASAIVVTASWFVARHGAAQQPRTRFTELWALPSTGAPRSMEIGVISHETSTTLFSLSVTRQGKEVWRSGTIRLQPGKRWQPPQPIVLPQGASSTATVLLFRRGVAGAYRRVVLRLPPMQKPGHGA